MKDIKPNNDNQSEGETTALLVGRTVFEAWALTAEIHDLSIAKRLPLSTYKVTGGYSNSRTQAAWEAWQAARHYTVKKALEDALNIALAYTEHAHERRQITIEIKALIEAIPTPPKIDYSKLEVGTRSYG